LTTTAQKVISVKRHFEDALGDNMVVSSKKSKCSDIDSPLKKELTHAETAYQKALATASKLQVCGSGHIPLLHMSQHPPHSSDTSGS